MNKKIITVIVGFVIVGSGSFYGGMKYGGSRANSAQNSQFRGAGGQGLRRGAGFGGGRAAGGQFIGGQIISKDDKSITVSLTDGGSKIVFLSASTTIGKTSEGTVNDLGTGIYVMIGGNANSDGSVTAQSVQIRPAPPTAPTTGTK